MEILVKVRLSFSWVPAKSLADETVVGDNILSFGDFNSMIRGVYSGTNTYYAHESTFITPVASCLPRLM